MVSVVKGAFLVALRGEIAEWRMVGFRGLNSGSLHRVVEGSEGAAELVLGVSVNLIKKS